MRKFTIFTILLTIIVVVVFGEIIVNEYLPNLIGGESAVIGGGGQADNGDELKLTLPTSLDVKKSISTNVLGSDLENYLGADVVSDDADADAVNGLTFKNPDPESAIGDFLPVDDSTDVIDEAPIIVPTIPETAPGLKDFEDESFISTANNVYLRDEQIKSAGFVGGYLEKEPFDGRLFKTVLIDDLTDVTIEKTVIRSETALLAKVYIFKVGLNANVNEVYELLKLRASQGLDIRINETNEYGLASFYMNDPTRSDTAFLTVRISGLIYSFSYPKPYHSQIKNLIKLIEWEME